MINLWLIVATVSMLGNFYMVHLLRIANFKVEVLERMVREDD